MRAKRFSVMKLALIAASSVIFFNQPFFPVCRADWTVDSSVAPRTDEESRTISIYRNTNEAVVFILTRTLSLDPNELIPELQSQEGSGSGVIVDAARGIVITNLHVIREADRMEIILADGSSHQARLIGYDDEFDIAVLQIREPPEHLTAIPFGDSSKLEVGQRVLAIGNPFGLNRSLTSGIISSLDRTVRGAGKKLLRGLVQTDAAINPGNSGGPLLDMQGRLIGINTAILSQSGDSAGIGFAIPINSIRRILPELIATGKVLRPTVGWILDDTSQGVMVRWVDPQGPAAAAGIEPAYRAVGSVFMRGYVMDYKRADFVYSVNGKPVSTHDEIEELISQADPRRNVSVVVRRGGIRGVERDVIIRPVLK